MQTHVNFKKNQKQDLKFFYMEIPLVLDMEEMFFCDMNYGIPDIAMIHNYGCFAVRRFNRFLKTTHLAILYTLLSNIAQCSAKLNYAQDVHKEVLNIKMLHHDLTLLNTS